MDGSTERSTLAFLQRADDLLRRAEDRLVRGVQAEFHATSIQELADAFSLIRVALWRFTGQESTVLARMGDECSATSEQAARAADSAEVSSATCEATTRRWLAREDVSDEVWVTVAAVAPATIPSAEFEEVLATMVRLHADAERRRRLGQLTGLLHRQNSLLNVIAELHTCRSSERLATVLATDAAPLMHVDRVSVVLVGPDYARLTAATGVTSPEHRANASRVIEDLAARCRDADQDLPWTAADELDDSSLQQSARRCCESSSSRFIRVQRVGPVPHAIIVLEQFESPIPETDLVAGLVPQAATALENLNLRSGPLLSRFSAAGRRFARRRSWWLIAAAVVLLALFVIPAEFTVEASGTLHPTQRRHIYAPEDGIITDVLAADSTRVPADAVLLQMTNPELDLQRERIHGELATAKSQLASVTAFGGVDPVTGLSATATADELEKQIASLDRQLELVDRQLASLKVQAPFGGLVFHGDLSRSLAGRPVKKGQFLLQLANPEARWEILLQIPHESIRHVLRHEGAREVTFILRLAPGRTYSAKLDWVGLSTDLDATGRLATPARVALDDSNFGADEFPELRPGSAVIAKIHCGRRSLGYVWFHDVIDVVQRKLLF